MTRKDNILNELTELNSSLVNIPSQNVYTVPLGYFDGLMVQVMNRIKAIEAKDAVEELGHLSPVLSNTTRQMPYSVPAGYFEGLAEQALRSVRESSDYLRMESFGQTAKEEIETLSPLLSGLKKQMPYTVPQGYFENIDTTPVKPVTKVISIVHRNWFKYAAAAVVTGVIMLTGFLVEGNKGDKSSRAMAIFDWYLNKEIKKMSDTELKDFIQYTDAGLTREENVSNNTVQEIKDLLKDVPEAELKEFLDETSDPAAEPSSMN